MNLPETHRWSGLLAVVGVLVLSIGFVVPLKQFPHGSHMPSSVEAVPWWVVTGRMQRFIEKLAFIPGVLAVLGLARWGWTRTSAQVVIVTGLFYIVFSIYYTLILSQNPNWIPAVGLYLLGVGGAILTYAGLERLYPLLDGPETSDLTNHPDT